MAETSRRFPAMLRLFLISGLLHAYVGWRLVPDLPGPPGAGALVGALLVANAALMPLTLLARRLRRQPLSDRLAWAGSLAMGFFSSLFVATLLRDVLLLLVSLVGFGLPQGFDTGEIARVSAAAVPLLALLASAVGLYNARRTAAVVPVDVPIAGLPAALDGFTIAQLSDIHVGPTIKTAYLRSIVDATNRLGADMVAVTGDLVDGSVPELGRHVGALAGLRSRHGTFFVTGNHEYYSGAPAWVGELRRIGLKVLMNEHVVLSHDGAALVVAGVTDLSAIGAGQEGPDLVAALAGAPDDAPVVLLDHQPRQARIAAAPPSCAITRESRSTRLEACAALFHRSSSWEIVRLTYGTINPHSASTTSGPAKRSPRRPVGA